MEEKDKITLKQVLPYLIGLGFFILIGFSFAYIRKQTTQANPNTGATLTCLSSTLTDVTSAVNITDAISISNEEGMKTDPYTFTITNNCSTYIKVYINLESLSTSTLATSYLRASLNNTGATIDTSKLLSAYTSATATISGATSNNLKTVFLAGNSSSTYDLRVWVDSTVTAEQGMNKAYHGKIVVIYDAVKQPSTPALAFAWQHNGEVTANGGMKSMDHAATGNQNYATTDYRYYGSNPNNYVTFNDELWRIIGVFEVEDDKGVKSYRLKLIRNDVIGNYSYDTSASTVNSGYGINEWSQSDLMKLLNPGYESNQDLNNSGTTITVNNSLYWNKSSGTCYNDSSNQTTTCDFTSTGLGATAKSMIDKAKYYIGGWNSYSTTTTQFYTYERGSNVMASPSDGVTRTTTWTGYVGLPYVSDYGYATDESLCLNTEYVGWNATTGYYGHAYCHTNDWMWKSSSSYWTMIPNSADSSSVWSVHAYGYANLFNANYGNAGSPVLYLKSSIKISGGSGTQTDPYTLSL